MDHLKLDLFLEERLMLTLGFCIKKSKQSNTVANPYQAITFRPAKGAVGTSAKQKNKDKATSHDIIFYIMNKDESANSVIVVVCGEGGVTNGSWLSKITDDMVRRGDGIFPLPFFQGTFYLHDETTGEKMLNDAKYPIRAHLLEIQVPEEEAEMEEVLGNVHTVLKEKLQSHIDANGHTVTDFDASKHIIGTEECYCDILGETGATYYLRRRYNPEPVPNWAKHNPHIMEAFYTQGSIKMQATVMATKCGTEWIHESFHNAA